MFEKNYIDCNLEETNCTTLIITPSTGVFEVDEELAVLTESRLIENGKLIKSCLLTSVDFKSVLAASLMYKTYMCCNSETLFSSKAVHLVKGLQPR